MKKIYVFTAVVFCCFTNFSFGQNGINYGVKGGLNLGTAQVEASAMGMTFEFDTQFRTSFYAGAFVEYSLENISSNLSGQVELQYVSNGFKIEESDFIPELTNKMNMLNIPVSVKYRLIDQLLLTGGFYGGFVLNVEEEIVEGEKYDATEDYKSFDAGFLVGLEIPLSDTFFLEARYNHGLANLVKAEIEGGSGSYKNRSIQAGVGFKF